MSASKRKGLIRLKTWHLSTLLILLTSFIFKPILRFPKSQAIITRTENLPRQRNETCFYSLHVPADMDEKAIAFDTTIVRRAGCSHHVLKLKPWGTETSYAILPPVASQAGEFEKYRAHFTHDQTGSIDITDLSSGTYRMQLLACGNGGTFTLRVK